VRTVAGCSLEKTSVQAKSHAQDAEGGHACRKTNLFQP